jgi:hypothetical protein
MQVASDGAAERHARKSRTAVDCFWSGHIHIDDCFIKDRLLDTGAMKPTAHAGYQEYFVITSDDRFFMEFARAGQVKPCLREDTDEQPSCGARH